VKLSLNIELISRCENHHEDDGFLFKT